MSSTNPSPAALARLRALVGELSSLAITIPELRELSDNELLDATRLHSDASRFMGSIGAAIAGELAFRSRPELGGEGLARRTGHRTVDTLLKVTTGAGREHVSTVLAAGALLVEAADAGRVDEVTGVVCVPSQPWLRALAKALAAGLLSTQAAKSISTGLGCPNSAVTTEQLAAAVDDLVGQAIAGVDSDKLFRAARDARADLDFASVRIREEELFLSRSLRHFPLAAGGGRATWDMDTETYATFVAVYDRMVSPKLGGVRFVDSDRSSQADLIASDERTPAQLASDGFIHLIVAGADADDSHLLGTGAPVIRLTVAVPALESGVGLARIDGQSTPVSIATAERMSCTGSRVTMRIDSFGNIVDTESEQRLFSPRQRDALAVKLGGCMDPDCDRPPSWTETHHIRFWLRDQGKTTIANGILLCKYHHLLYHNRGYEIEVDERGQYWKIPPASVDPAQSRIPMPLKSRNLTDLAASTARSVVQPAPAA